MRVSAVLSSVALATTLAATLPVESGQQNSSVTLEALKREVAEDVEKRREFSQQMVDMIFSFGELGFQETETSRYLIGFLKKNGF
jgi:aminobenzoyl-glutamate utilization protein B